jgi:thymidylate synthase ThyX
LGVDIGMFDVESIPDLADSSWWSQSMRIQNMGKFATNGAYRLPASVVKHRHLQAVFEQTMKDIQDSYNHLVDAGIPMEDARELIPLGAQHRISWRLNIGSLQHIVGKRGCWILQLGIWGPVIQGMIRELCEKVDPIFGELVTPPCLEGDRFKGCAYHEECRRRLDGSDALPPCPLHFRNHALPEALAKAETIAMAGDPEVQAQYDLPRAEEMRTRAEDYRQFWRRDPYTGRRL